MRLPGRLLFGHDGCSLSVEPGHYVTGPDTARTQDAYPATPLRARSAAAHDLQSTTFGCAPRGLADAPARGGGPRTAQSPSAAPHARRECRSRQPSASRVSVARPWT